MHFTPLQTSLSEACTHKGKHNRPLHTHRSHLKLGKLLCFVAGVLCIDELGKEEFTELRALRKESKDTERSVLESACEERAQCVDLLDC